MSHQDESDRDGRIYRHIRLSTATLMTMLSVAASVGGTYVALQGKMNAASDAAMSVEKASIERDKVLEVRVTKLEETMSKYTELLGRIDERSKLMQEALARIEAKK